MPMLPPPPSRAHGRATNSGLSASLLSLSEIFDAPGRPLFLLATPAGMPGASAVNGLDLQTSHNVPIDANSVSRAVTNRSPRQGSGVQHLYRMFDADGRLLYVGISSRMPRRMADHNKFSRWFCNVAQIKLEKFGTRELVVQAEANAIKAEKPKYNVHHKAIEKPRNTRQRFSSDYLIAKLVGIPDPQPPPRVELYAPLYRLTRAGDVIGIGPTHFKRLVERGEIGTIEIEGKKYVTGWQILEYIENKEVEAEQRRPP
jgi:predicted GIY-YIG superfamily endonuclease